MKKLIILTIIYLTTNTLAIAQEDEKNKLFGISGKVVDDATGEFMEYATVTLITISDSSMIDGTTTNIDGEFSIQTNSSGEMLLKVGFIGFERKYQRINLNEENPQLNMGEIRLEAFVETF